MSFQFECGILLVRHVRDFLERARLYHPDLRWHESRGWFTRTFTIAGDLDTLQNLAGSITRWAKINDLLEISNNG